jgi:CelD/BcsL family acetyltransferase involved in cellulose biosynthesis
LPNTQSSPASQPGIQWTRAPASALRQATQAWDALSAEAGDVPFLQSRFLLPLLEEFGDGQQELALCHQGKRLVAAALLQPQGLGRWATFQPSQLPLGAWLVAPGHDGELLARALLKQLSPTTLRLGLTQIDPQLCPRPAAGPRLATLDYIDTAWVDIDSDFDSYWEARGKNLRSNMRKQRSKLEADGEALCFDRLSSPEEVDAALIEYGRLETAGWKGSSGTAVHPDNAQGRFYGRMMRSFCAEGRAEIWRLRFGDKTVAMDLCIQSGSTLVILKTAFDPSYRTVSPAFLLKQEAFKQLFDEGRLRRIEFYGRLMEWHTRWTTNARTLYHVNADRWAWIPSLQRRLQRLRPSRTAAPSTSAASADGEQG